MIVISLLGGVKGFVTAYYRRRMCFVDIVYDHVLSFELVITMCVIQYMFDYVEDSIPE